MKLPESLSAFPRSRFGAHVLLARLGGARPRGELEQRVRRLEAERDVRELVTRYMHAFDGEDLDLLLGLYDDAAVLVNGFGTWRGLDAIRASHAYDAAKTEYSLHNVLDANVVLDDACDEAWLSGYLYNFAALDGGLGGNVATCVFHVRRPADGWRVAECRTASLAKHGFAPAPVAAEPGRPQPSEPQTSRDLVGG